MDYAICLDQFSTNFDVNNLSSNGFSIYTNLDNYTTPIAQNIPYQDLFAPPIGNCPLVVTLPQGATQLVVIDACTTLPTNIASIFTNGSSTANNLITQCCYAIINVPTQSISWCDTADLSFDVFSASFVGQIIAGNLNSSIGSVTDYTIGWYKDGDYSSPEFVSGYGNAFVPYQLTHPLAANTAPYVTAGDWEGIIHDIAINGITYSSVSGSANGTPIPFISCFGTIVVAPLTCNNGTFPLPYTHQKSFTAAGNGAPPPIIGATYVLSDTTNYFAYRFDGYNVWDELEIKFISGDPNNTGNPSLYSQPIYLEKVQIGLDVTNPNTISLPQITNNNYPKKIKYSYYKRIFTLTNISRSANPSLPDSLEIKISPNSTNNQTNWKLQMQCLDTFDCDECLDQAPPPISYVELNKDCCNTIIPTIKISSSCDSGFDIWDSKLLTYAPSTVSQGYTMGGSYLASTFTPTPIEIPLSFYPLQVIASTSCYSTGINPSNPCSPATPNSIISYHKSVTTVNGQLQGIISMSFNNQTDYQFYKDKLIDAKNSLNNGLSVANFNFNPTQPQYYSMFRIWLPKTTAPCGDGVIYEDYWFHPSTNITYVENPSNNYWSITIPMPTIINGLPPSICSSCDDYSSGNTTIINASSLGSPDLDVTNNYGSKLQTPVGYLLVNSYPGGYQPNDMMWDVVNSRQMPYYSWNTLPFISSVSSPTGWVNLPTLNANPCPSLVSSNMPYSTNGYPTLTHVGFSNYGYDIHYFLKFPNLTASVDWFQIYTGVTSSNGGHVGPLYTPSPQYMIYEYSASIGTVYSSSYFINGAPTLNIETTFPNC